MAPNGVKRERTSPPPEHPSNKRSKNAKGTAAPGYYPQKLTYANEGMDTPKQHTGPSRHVAPLRKSTRSGSATTAANDQGGASQSLPNTPVEAPNGPVGQASANTENTSFSMADADDDDGSAYSKGSYTGRPLADLSEDAFDSPELTPRDERVDEEEDRDTSPLAPSDTTAGARNVPFGQDPADLAGSDTESDGSDNDAPTAGQPTPQIATQTAAQFVAQANAQAMPQSATQTAAQNASDPGLPPGHQRLAGWGSNALGSQYGVTQAPDGTRTATTMFGTYHLPSAPQGGSFRSTRPPTGGPSGSNTSIFGNLTTANTGSQPAAQGNGSNAFNSAPANAGSRVASHNVPLFNLREPFVFGIADAAPQAQQPAGHANLFTGGPQGNTSQLGQGSFNSQNGQLPQENSFSRNCGQIHNFSFGQAPNGSAQPAQVSSADFYPGQYPQANVPFGQAAPGFSFGHVQNDNSQFGQAAQNGSFNFGQTSQGFFAQAGNNNPQSGQAQQGSFNNSFRQSTNGNPQGGFQFGQTLQGNNFGQFANNSPQLNQAQQGNPHFGQASHGSFNFGHTANGDQQPNQGQQGVCQFGQVPNGNQQFNPPQNGFAFGQAANNQQQPAQAHQGGFTFGQTSNTPFGGPGQRQFGHPGPSTVAPDGPVVPGTNITFGADHFFGTWRHAAVPEYNLPEQTFQPQDIVDELRVELNWRNTALQIAIDGHRRMIESAEGNPVLSRVSSAAAQNIRRTTAENLSSSLAYIENTAAQRELQRQLDWLREEFAGLQETARLSDEQLQQREERIQRYQDECDQLHELINRTDITPEQLRFVARARNRGNV